MLAVVNPDSSPQRFDPHGETDPSHPPYIKQPQKKGPFNKISALLFPTIPGIPWFLGGVEHDLGRPYWGCAKACP